MSSPLREGFFVVVITPLLSGCSQILGTDDYSIADPDGGGSPQTVEWPLLPAEPDDEPGLREGCATCVREKCTDERRICLGSERCKEMLWCMGPGGETKDGCSDPNCIFRCLSEHPDSPYFQAYFACAFAASASPTPTASPCVNECKAGHNWDCVGIYDWNPASTTTSPVLDVQTYDLVSGQTSLGGPLPTFQFVEIVGCGDSYPTQSPPPGDYGCAPTWMPVDPYGRVLDFPFDKTTTAIAVRSAYADAFWPEPGQVGSLRYYPHPLFPSGVSDAAPLVLPIISDSSLTYNADVLACQGDPQCTSYNSTLGLVTAAQFDCLGTAASADIQIADAPGVKRAAFGFNVQDPTSTYASSFIFVDVPPNQKVVLTATREGGTQVSRKSVLVASGWFTSVDLYPMSATGN